MTEFQLFRLVQYYFKPQVQVYPTFNVYSDKIVQYYWRESLNRLSRLVCVISLTSL